jgi:hypothetical protein
MSMFKSWRARVALFLAVVGPGFITASVDNDAGGIATYSVAGAQFGYSLLWTMIPITIALVIIQEMSSRMGAVTGKGLSDLIREEFGLRATFLLMIALFSHQLLQHHRRVRRRGEQLRAVRRLEVHRRPAVGVRRLGHRRARHLQHGREGVPVGVAVLRRLHRVGRAAHPDWRAAALSTLTRPDSVGFRNYGYLSMIHRPRRHDHRAVDAVLPAGLDRREGRDDAAVHGVAPGRHHRVPVRGDCRLVHRGRVRGDAALDRQVQHRDRRDAALALRPLAGEYAYLLFAAGLFNASLFAASILPISTAYAVCEGLGLESGLDKRFDEAPAFYWLYTLLIVFGAGVVLIPRFPLFRVMVLSQVANGVLLPFVLIFVLLLINDRELMGKHTNSRWFNVISWVTVG